MLPATGSTTTAAMPGCASNVAATAAASLNGTTMVCAANAAGTPGESGSPSVATPEPAEASRPSAWPW